MQAAHCFSASFIYSLGKLTKWPRSWLLSGRSKMYCGDNIQYYLFYRCTFPAPFVSRNMCPTLPACQFTVCLSDSMRMCRSVLALSHQTMAVPMLLPPHECTRRLCSITGNKSWFQTQMWVQSAIFGRNNGCKERRKMKQCCQGVGRNCFVKGRRIWLMAARIVVLSRIKAITQKIQWHFLL